MDKITELAEDFLHWIHENVMCQDRLHLQYALIEFSNENDCDPILLEEELLTNFQFSNKQYLNCEEYDFINPF